DQVAGAVGRGGAVGPPVDHRAARQRPRRDARVAGDDPQPPQQQGEVLVPQLPQVAVEGVQLVREAVLDRPAPLPRAPPPHPPAPYPPPRTAMPSGWLVQRSPSWLAIAPVMSTQPPMPVFCTKATDVVPDSATLPVGCDRPQ